MKENVLVFPCGSEIGLEIYKSLESSIHFNIFGGSSVNDHGKFVYSNYIKDIPFVNSPDFINVMNKIIDEHDIKYIFPAHDDVVLKLSQESAKGNLHCRVITSPVKTCEITRSKKKTYETFMDIVSVPHIFSDINNITNNDYPVFLKPDVGQGSKGTYIAESIADVEFYIEKDPSLLILEYLPGKEFTVDCFTDNKGELLFCEGRERVRIQNGISVNSTTSTNDGFRKIAEKINKTLNFTGVWFFQLKENIQGKLVLMEIAPRVAGTMGMVRCKGVNLPLLSLFNEAGNNVSITENSCSMVVDRALQNRYHHNIEYTHVYMDFDDLVIFEGKVNPLVLAFVFQCINRNIKIHLITRHKEDINLTLKKYRLYNIFDEIIMVSDSDQKHTYIKEKDAIFIDDSFAERKAIHDECGIPVFDVHMIESLMAA